MTANHTVFVKVTILEGGQAMTTTMDVNEAKKHLVQLLDLAKQGNEVFISEGSTPVARLTAVVPAPSTRKPRIAGLHAGAVWVSDDFDAELPEEFWVGNP